MKAQPMTFYLPDTRDVEISRYGKGNLKLGPNVYSYSRVAGGAGALGTCPGATEECEAICYAKRIRGPVYELYVQNTISTAVPPLPADARLVRIHVSGDFDSVNYIQHWIDRANERPDVKLWAYTRSWRVAELLPHLEALRALPNVQLFASMDASCPDMPPSGWRRAWIYRTWDSAIASGRPMEDRLMFDLIGPNDRNLWCITDGTPSYTCPEETGHKPDCESCRYCFDGQRNDVVFLEH